MSFRPYILYCSFEENFKPFYKQIFLWLLFGLLRSHLLPYRIEITTSVSRNYAGFGDGQRMTIWGRSGVMISGTLSSLKLKFTNGKPILLWLVWVVKWYLLAFMAYYGLKSPPTCSVRSIWEKEPWIALPAGNWYCLVRHTMGSNEFQHSSMRFFWGRKR